MGLALGNDCCCGKPCHICTEGNLADWPVFVVTLDGIGPNTTPGSIYGNAFAGVAPWDCPFPDCGDANGAEMVFTPTLTSGVNWYGFSFNTLTFDPFACMDPTNGIGYEPAPMLGNGTNEGAPIDLNDRDLVPCWTLGFGNSISCHDLSDFVSYKFAFAVTMFFLTMPDGLYFFARIDRTSQTPNDSWYSLGKLSDNKKITCSGFDETFAVQEFPDNNGNGTGGLKCSRPAETGFIAARLANYDYSQDRDKEKYGLYLDKNGRNEFDGANEVRLLSQGMP